MSKTVLFLKGNVSWVQTVVRQVSFTLHLFYSIFTVILSSTRGTIISDNWFVHFYENKVM